MNVFKLQMADGSVVENPTIEGLEVHFKLDGGEVLIHEGAVFRNAKIVIAGGSRIVVEKTHRRGLINTIMDLSGYGKNKQLHIKSGVSIESARFAMGNESDLSVVVGHDCMMSSSITFRPTDGHTIYDLDTKEVINRAKPIVVGDNCWIGSEVVFLKGAVVASNSIVGTRTVVATAFADSNVVLAGVPAKVVRRNVGWSREHIDNYKIDS